MKILVVNDDGIHDPGIWALAAEMSALGDVRVYSPDRNYSGAGMSLSLTATLHLRPAAPPAGIDLDVPAYTVDATPATMAAVGAMHGFPADPDVVVSGINNGWNPGAQSYVSSGTVGAARVGVDRGRTGIAVSASWRERLEPPADGSEAQDHARARLSMMAAGVARLIRSMQAEKLTGRPALVNINFPEDYGLTSPVRLTTPARFTLFKDLHIVKQAADGDGGVTLELSYGEFLGGPCEVGDEIDALRAGAVSVCVTEPFSGRVLRGDPWPSVAQAIGAGV